ncbi:MAG: hypothetical protein ACRD5H_16355 [Nitrososphaerales archaeon]
MPKKAKVPSQSELQREQIRLLNLIYQELQKLNSNSAISARPPIADSASGSDNGSDEELDSYE